jgi:hypothetical protein
LDPSRIRLDLLPRSGEAFLSVALLFEQPSLCRRTGGEPLLGILR